MGFSKIAAFSVLVLVAAALMHAAEGQPSSTPSCANKLVPCANYINATKPPSACCDALREAVTNEMTCLCTLYNSGYLPSLGINLTEALTLPKRCNIPGGLNSCVKASSPISPTSSSEPPPATTGNDKGGVGRIAWTGMSGILLIWAFLMLF